MSIAHPHRSPKPLPTLSSLAWTATDLFDSIKAELSADRSGTHLRFYMYQVSLPGWELLREPVATWLRARSNRGVTAFIGTDHGFTHPEALQMMKDDGVEVWIPTDYEGIYHPKVLWLESPKAHVLWIGSNNLTEAALSSNIECASVIAHPLLPAGFDKWRTRIAESSQRLTDDLLDSYRGERREHGKRAAKLGTFVWSKRTSSSSNRMPAQRVPAAPGARRNQAQAGDLVLEVTPKETGGGGAQVQIPKRAAISFFRVPGARGSQRRINLRFHGAQAPRQLTMTLFGNQTVRLSLSELDYTHRPCLLRFHHMGGDRYEYEIIQKSQSPGRFNALLNLCPNRTRMGARRWGILE